jgi:hypothetical protein
MQIRVGRAVLCAPKNGLQRSAVPAESLSICGESYCFILISRSSPWMRVTSSFAGSVAVTYAGRRMPKYVLGHHLKGEGKRLGLMSELLDPGRSKWNAAMARFQHGSRSV